MGEGLLMSCAEGKRLSALFLQATLATRDLEAANEEGERRTQEIESVFGPFAASCKSSHNSV
jgi:hypothetical protein